MNKYLTTVLGSAVIALSLGMVACTTPNQAPVGFNGSTAAADAYWWYSSDKPHQLPAIHFEWNSAVISPTWTNELNDLAAGLKAHPSAVVTLVGFTDSTGDVKYNQRLGYKRGQAIAHYLIAQGVAPTQIRITTAGDRFPVANNVDSVGQYMNRRVDIFVSPR